MTTIAWDGRTLAADTRATSDGQMIPGETVKKLHRLRNGDVFGAAGNVDNVLTALEWVRAGMRPKSRPRLSGAFQGIIAHTNGTASWMQDGLRPSPVTSKFMALGSGECYAMTAMYLGKSAKEAVEIASQFDLHTGGKVTFMRPGRAAINA